jgi:hypothetical protein
MPLSPQIPQLGQGFLVLFDPELAPITTPDSARVWAQAYTAWAIVGGVVAAAPKESLLASALTVAFNPNSGGAGPALFIQAIVGFWMGLPVPEQLGVVSAVIPTGSVDSPQPPDATPQQQAQGLAQVIAGFTLGAVKVQLIAPPNPIVPLL